MLVRVLESAAVPDPSPPPAPGGSCSQDLCFLSCKQPLIPCEILPHAQYLTPSARSEGLYESRPEHARVHPDACPRPRPSSSSEGPGATLPALRCSVCCGWVAISEPSWLLCLPGRRDLARGGWSSAGAASLPGAVCGLPPVCAAGVHQWCPKSWHCRRAQGASSCAAVSSRAAALLSGTRLSLHRIILRAKRSHKPCMWCDTA